MSQVQPLMIPKEFAETIDKLVVNKLTEYKGDSGKLLGYRPFRPSDFNLTLNVDTRHYQTTGLTNAWVYLQNNASGVTIPPDSFYLIWGFKIIEDIVPLSQQSRLQVFIDGVFKAEFCPKIVQNLEENCLLMIDSILEAKPAQNLEIRIHNGNGALTNAVIIPLGYRFSLKSTTDVT